ncbi:hypothetical protein ETAA8_48420 [Anatilimnocola aggregata]|uniref:Uncharacterized protein n=1 Tax=Anatilimnocola aggregata TaxID=2528021 RepID=A0A517YHK9_9BACT|nr:hypothetical protein [Anatilimnocola aggregata]QDU29727.1 hypothetical protein ETAA8_48420 [Anatilimnocola aggregata]
MKRILTQLRYPLAMAIVFAFLSGSLSSLARGQEKADDTVEKKDDKTEDTEAVKKAERQKAAEAKKAADDAKKAADEAKKAADDAKKAADEAKREEERRKTEEARIAREAKMKADAEEARIAREAKMKLEAEEAAARAALKALADRGDACLKVKISRTPDEVFRAVARMSAGGDKSLPDDERFQLYMHAGEWEKLHDLIVVYPGEQPARLHGKLVGELMWANPKAVLLPNDVLRIADASPVELNDKQTIAFGKLLAQTIAKNDSRSELMTLLRKGTKLLGGSDPEKRHAASRVLAAAEFWNEAKEFGLKESEIPELTAGIKPDAPTKFDPNFEPIVAKLHEGNLSKEDRDAAFNDLHAALLQATPSVVRNRLGQILKDSAHPELAWEVVALIGRKTARGQGDIDFAIRRSNLELQEAAVMLLAENKLLSSPPGPTFANLYARNWLAEAQQSYGIFPNWKKATPEGKEKYQHVTIEELLRAKPAGSWLAAVEPQLASSVKLMIGRLTLMSDNIERIVPQLAEISKRDKTTAAELGNAYLIRWAQLHDPSFTPEAMKQYKLDGHAIVLTRAEQDQSLRQLGAMLAALDPETRKLLDENMTVTAFDLCHSKAEIYTRDQIAQVFGPLENQSPTLLLSLLERMRFKLGAHWRNLAIQRDAATKRDNDDVFQLVNEGYAEAEKIATEWLAAHPDDWRTTCTAGSVLAEWAEFSYFQAVASDNDTDRFATYLKRSSAALDRFRAGAKAYAEYVPKASRTEFTLLPYRSWFYGLLGIANDSDINLRKGVTHESLVEISQAMKSLPNGAGGVHLQMFSTMVADNVKANVIAPQMKYRYLSSAVEITGRNATVYPAEEKVQYYESLLREIRLRSRVDGSAKIRQNGEFGVFVTLVHTADLAREAGGFGKYLQNETRRVVSGKTIVEQPLYRDRFEEALRLAIGDFFELKSIVFADPNAGSQPMVPDSAEVSVSAPTAADANTPSSDLKDWHETPLAYLHLVAKDATVDRVPPLEIELDFFDRDGKVVIPLPSNPLLIEIASDAPARRVATDIAITEIVDARELAEHKRLKMDVIATSHGLVPDLEELIDLQAYGLKVTNVDNREGLHVSELHSGDDGMYAKSERNWTVELDPSPLLQGATNKVEFKFPQPKNEAIAVTYRTYKDMDPVDAAAQVVLMEGKEAAAIAEPNYAAWIIGGLATLAIVGLAIAKVFWKKTDEADAGPPAFIAPRDATPFSVISLLHRIRTSPIAKLSDAQRAELQREIVTLEQAAFAVETSPRSKSDLQSLADRWINVALAGKSGAQAV